MSNECEITQSFKGERKVSLALAAFEKDIMAALDECGLYQGEVECDLLPEIAGNIFDTLLRSHVPLAAYETIHVLTDLFDGQLLIQCETKLVRPIPVKICLSYRMENDSHTPLPADAKTYDQLALVPDSLDTHFETSAITRPLVRAMNIHGMIAKDLTDPSGIVRDTLQRRFQDGYGYSQQLGYTGLQIAKNVVRVAIARRGR